MAQVSGLWEISLRSLAPQRALQEVMVSIRRSLYAEVKPAGSGSIFQAKPGTKGSATYHRFKGSLSMGCSTS